MNFRVGMKTFNQSPLRHQRLKSQIFIVQQLILFKKLAKVQKI